MDASNKRFRKQLSMPGLLNIVGHKFTNITDPLESDRSRKTLADCMMSGLAMFLLKYPSLLAFNDARSDPFIKRNLACLFGVEDVPSDTYLRKRLDVVDPEELRSSFKAIFSVLQRGKALEAYNYLDDAYLLSIDGTGFYSSDQIHCEQCNMKESKKSKKKTYYHQMLNAVLVHPDKHEVIPLSPEAILKGDGDKKNDCERNAAKRLLNHIRREHPHLKLIVIEDGLSSNGPHIRLLQELTMSYILGLKPNDHKFLFDWVSHSTLETHEEIDEDGTIHHYQFLNKVPLNDANFDLEVNFLDYEEIKPNGKKQHFSWVTDFTLSTKNVRKIMKGGRARWKIENETFNTLKNQGYHYEHNFGHGYQHLCTVFAYLMMLAFLIDQTQQLCCRLFQAAWSKMKRKKYLWERIRSLFTHFLISDWENYYQAIIHGTKLQPLYINPA